jgi:hypothetical protein
MLIVRKRNPDGVKITIKTKRVSKKTGHTSYIDFDEEDADIVILAYQPGIGKTHNAIEYIKKKENANTIYFTNRHKVMEERIKEWDETNNPIPTHWYCFDRLCKIQEKKDINLEYPLRNCVKIVNKKIIATIEGNLI